jgi:hypothetical protein
MFTVSIRGVGDVLVMMVATLSRILDDIMVILSMRLAVL